jgi:hypothetical protein
MNANRLDEMIAACTSERILKHERIERISMHVFPGGKCFHVLVAT